MSGETERRQGMEQVLLMITELQEDIKSNTALTKEIAQRQTEITIPRLRWIEDTLNGVDGKPGLLHMHAQCYERIENAEKRIGKVEGNINKAGWSLISILGAIVIAVLSFLGREVYLITRVAK